MDRFYAFLAEIGYTHPLHPPWTCFPIGLVLGGVIFALAAVPHKYSHYAATARHCLTLAFIGVFPTILFGLMDWYYYHGGHWIAAIKMKMILSAVLVMLLLAALLLHRRMTSRTIGLLSLYLLSAATVIGIGWYGGEIVFGSATNATGRPQAEMDPAGNVTYADVQAIFDAHCVICHSGSQASADLRLTDYHELLLNEAVVAPGKPQESELIRRVKGITTPQMPPNRPPLSATQISILEHWIKAGAPQ